MTAEPAQSRRRAGVVGSPISHSLSPVLHRAAYAALRLSNWDYQADDVRAGSLVSFVHDRDDSWVGLSVTMPGKEEALSLAASSSERARRTGAANTLIRSEQGWWADNTDIDGITRAFAEHGCRQGRRGWLVGSGATARSALVAFADMGVREVIVQVRAQPRAETMCLAQQLGMSTQVFTYEQGPPDVDGVDVAISTVPAGAGMPMPASPDGARRSLGLVAMDVVYHPQTSDWSRALGDHGAVVVDGAAMLLHQACVQVELMTGQQAPVEAMRSALRSELALRGELAEGQR